MVSTPVFQCLAGSCSHRGNIVWIHTNGDIKKKAFCIVKPYKSIPRNKVADENVEKTEDESEVEQTTSRTPCTKLFSSTSAPGKRSAKSSPEVTSGNSKRDKKKKKQCETPSKPVRSSSR